MRAFFLVSWMLMCNICLANDCRQHIELTKDNPLSLQLTAPGAVYVIRDVFDLQGSTVRIPDDCILDFRGGKIMNGLLTGSIKNKYVRPEDVGGFNERGLFNALAICPTVRLSKGTTYTVGDSYYPSSLGHFPINNDRVIEGYGATIKVVARNTNGTFFDVVGDCTLTVKDLNILYRVGEGGYGQMFRMLNGRLCLEQVSFDAQTPSFSGFIDVEKCKTIRITGCKSKISTTQSGGFLWVRNSGGESRVTIRKTTIVHDTRDECIAFYTNSSQKAEVAGKTTCLMDRCRIEDINLNHWGCISYYESPESGVELTVELDVRNTTFVTLSKTGEITDLSKFSSFIYNGSSRPLTMEGRFKNCDFDLGMRLFTHGIGADRDVSLMLDHCKVSAFSLYRLYTNQDIDIKAVRSRLELCCLSFGADVNTSSLELVKCKTKLNSNRTSVEMQPFQINVSSFRKQKTKLPNE